MMKRFSSSWCMAELYVSNGHVKAASLCLCAHASVSCADVQTPGANFNFGHMLHISPNIMHAVAVLSTASGTTLKCKGNKHPQHWQRLWIQLCSNASVWWLIRLFVCTPIGVLMQNVWVHRHTFLHQKQLQQWWRLLICSIQSLELMYMASSKVLCSCKMRNDAWRHACQNYCTSTLSQTVCTTVCMTVSLSWYCLSVSQV